MSTTAPEPITAVLPRSDDAPFAVMVAAATEAPVPAVPPVFTAPQPPARPHAIGDWLAARMPGVALLPCTYCGEMLADADAIHYSAMFSRLHELAAAAGWVLDIDRCWTCPECQLDGEWLGRQYPLVLSGGPAHGGVCAVSVLMASERYRPDVAEITRAAAARIEQMFRAVFRGVHGAPEPGRHARVKGGAR